ncbi:sugar ABC transporter permease [Paenibacillus sp.]|uniref:carbohydrate ABC transporter permease n=1 Tax=Paenibacillus sp. TaxID=58172 RepID=UPI002D560065|nr:sugar ABC transporter permease [Paenibacillus sp.]HZG55274.1 sugar ABC transporter permease [Paenibacillus sp.]
MKERNMSTSSERAASRKGGLNPAVVPYLFIVPCLLFLTTFLIYPIGNLFYFSFQNYNINAPYYNGFAGFANFKKALMDDPLFFRSLGISAKWVFSQVALQCVLGLALALLLNQTFRFRGLFRSLAFVPWAISGVITSLIWSVMFNEHMGLINDLFLRFGWIDRPVAWTANVSTVFKAVVVAELWRGLPFFAITFLAALQAIPNELYEASRVDGANRLKQFYYVTLPYLKNAIVLTTLLRTAWEFNNVDLIFNMTGGGPAHATTTLTMYVVELAVKGGDFGYGSALTVISFFLLMLFSITYLCASRFGKES